MFAFVIILTVVQLGLTCCDLMDESVLGLNPIKSSEVILSYSTYGKEVLNAVVKT